MSIVAMKRALEALWNCTVKLESQQFRNPVQIPPVYSDIIKAGYSAHAALRAAIEAAERQEPVTCKECGNPTMHSGNVCYGCAQKVEPAYTFHLDETGKAYLKGACVSKEGDPLYTTPQPAIPDGWQLVPVEPTPEMSSFANTGVHWQIAERIYKAMLAAAPEVPK